MIDETTLYYLFSTNAQLLGALVAILAAFVHFRVTRLQDYLIGDGQAIYDNWDTDDYKELFERINLKSKAHTLKSRLKDGISRKNIYEIKDVLVNINSYMKKAYHVKIENDLMYIIEDWFLGTEKKIRKLKEYTILISGLAIFTIILSLVLLAFTNQIILCLCYAMMSLILNLLFTVTILILSFFLIYMGLSDNVKHETNTINPL